MSRALGQTKRTPEVDARIAQAIRLGGSYRDAAAYAGISEDTLARWRKRFADFAALLARAEAEAKVHWLARIEQAGAQDWRALAWKLERRYPAEWGRVDRLELTLRQQAAEVATALGLPPALAARAEAEVPKLLSEYRAAQKAQTG
jgi:hypothetical protein